MGTLWYFPELFSCATLSCASSEVVRRVKDMGNLCCLCSETGFPPVTPNSSFIRPDPTPVTPSPITVAPRPSLVRPEPTTIRPNPINVIPKPIDVRPNSIIVTPKPSLVRPEHTPVRPNPVIPKPVDVKPNPIIAPPKLTNFRPNPINITPKPTLIESNPILVTPKPSLVEPIPTLIESEPNRIVVSSDAPIITPESTLVRPNPSLIIRCLETLPTDKLCQEMIAEYRQNPNSIHPKTKKLYKGSLEYQEIECLFYRTNKRNFHITNIEKIYNPYILIQYYTKKMYLEEIFGHVQEKFVFHGTKKSNIQGIVNNNFNWRLRGKSKGHIFGQGVSFTPISNYATHYGDKSNARAMFLVKILIGRSTPGGKETTIPPDGYDTTHKPNHHVYVKYDDNTFCPTHVIYYYENRRY